MTRRSLIEYFKGFRIRGRDIAYVQPSGYRMVRRSYREVAELASQLARELEARGVSRGDRVLLWGSNSAEWLAVFWGCVLRGAVVVPMDQIASAEFALRVAHQAEAKLWVCTRERAQLQPGIPTILLGDLGEMVAHHSRGPYESPDLDRHDIVEIVFTSGTTAEPKGVAISHGNVLANLEPLESEVQKYLKYARWFHPLRFLNLLPLSHVFGQFLGIFVPPLLGATVIFHDSLNPSQVIRTIKRERVTVLVVVPRVLEALRAKIERDIDVAGETEKFQKNFRAAEGEHFLKRVGRFRKIHSHFGWKFWAIISGGAALPAETETFWARLGYALVQGYGLTETTSLVSVNHPFRVGRGSIGKVVPGREIKLDESGEILVRGEGVAVGYWQEGRLEPVEGPSGGSGWYRTGDVGELDAQGNLYFRGRKKNVIVTPAGMNIYPEDLEVALRREPEVRDCVVLSLSRDGNAEPCAVLLLQDRQSDPEAIIRRANQSLAEYQQMRCWHVWPEEDFPRTTTQKPRINAIQQAVETQQSAPASAQTSRGGELADLIRGVARQSAPGRVSEKLFPDAQLGTDLNLSSIDRVELLSALEDRYQIELNEAAFTGATTIGELERLLHQSAPPESGLQRRGYKYPRWTQRWPITWIRFGLYYLLAWPATLLLGSPRISGRENLRGVLGPVLAIANHTVPIDAAFVLFALPARLRHRLAVAMGGERLWAMRYPPVEWNFLRRWLARIKYALLVTIFNVFPLPKHAGFRESFAYVGASVDRGYSVLVFPEGEITQDGKIGPFRTGIGLLANRLNLPVVSMRLDGLFELQQARRRNLRFGQVRITIGAPVTFSPDAEPEQITRALEMRVCELGLRKV